MQKASKQIVADMISIIICSIDPAKYKKVTQNYRSLLGNEPHEIIGIHDAKSLAEGYHRGIRKSSGAILVFCHDDIEILSPDFSKKLRTHLKTYDLIGAAGTTRLIGPGWIQAGQPYIHGQITHYDKKEDVYATCVYSANEPVVSDIQAIDGLFMAAKREVTDSVRFDEARLDGFHLYDIDFSYSAYRAGFKVAVCNDIIIIHYSGGSFAEKWRYYADRFLEKHGASLFQMPQPAVYFATYYFKDKNQVLSFCLENLEKRTHYQEWIKRRALTETDMQLYEERMTSQWKSYPVIHLIIDLHPSDKELLADTLDSLEGQFYPNWRLSVIATFPAPILDFDEMEGLKWIQIDSDSDLADAINNVATSTPSDWVVLIDPGVRFEPKTLFIISDYINLHPEWRLIYTDEDAINAKGERFDHKFKPDFNLDMLRSMPYPGYCFIRCDMLADVGGYSHLPGAENYDLSLKVLDQGGETAIGHIADVLLHIPPAWQTQKAENSKQALMAHLKRNGVAAEVKEGYLSGTFQVLYQHDQTPLVSIIIPTKDKFKLFKSCIETLLEKTDYPNYEVIVVDNQSSQPDALHYYRTLEKRGNIRIVRYPRPFNFAAICNFAAKEAHGDYLLFLNNDTEVIEAPWLSRMMLHAQRPDVGIVGARLVCPGRGLIQHAGIILGLGGGRVVDQPYYRILAATEAGYMNRTHIDQNFSAVSGACLLIRKSLYNDLSGFDEERFTTLYADVDLCLKVEELNYKIVWTPYATLIHHGAATLDSELDTPIKQAEWVEKYKTDRDALLEKWPSKIANDPAYNQHLSLTHIDYRLETNVIINWDTHFHDRPRILGIPLPEACGEYRIISPFRALNKAGMARCNYVPILTSGETRVLKITELMRAAPDSIVLHAAISDIQIETLGHYKKFSRTLRLFTLDDLITHRREKDLSETYRNVEPRLRKALSLCDRLIVATTPLADLCNGMISDIRIIPNCIEQAVWGGLNSKRRQGPRPRVGWAGAQQHHEDLALIVEVVQKTANTVDWVFFGMCPGALRPYVKEFYDFVQPFENYPPKLASLNLDLAVAPLTVEPFNEAKSNLRLLELGILGIPVICTDIYPYQQAPARRLPNHPQKWIEAIRERVSDLDATGKEGDQMKKWVEENYLLENRLGEWLSALTG